MPAWECLYMWREDRFIAFSQNLITDPGLIKRLINKSDISISDKILEIGAGKGLITKELSKVCRQVIAIEIDKKYFKTLTDTVEAKNVILINDNILNVKLPSGSYKVFSNIPFNYTSRIVNKLYFQNNPPQSAYLVMQKEASNIYTGIRRETQKSLLLKPFFTFEILYRFNRTDFRPAPSVDAVMFCVHKRETPLVDKSERKNYFDFIVYGTSQYKTTLQKSLSKIFTHEQFKRLSKTLVFSMKAKPLDLTYKQWVELYKYFNNFVAEDKKLLIKGSYNKQRSMQDKLKKYYRTNAKKY